MTSIKTKLIATILALLIAGIGGLSLVSYTKTSQILTDNLEKSITTIAQSTGREIGLWLDGRKGEVAVIANSSMVLTGNKESILPYLNAEVNRNKLFSNFFVADAKGDYYITPNSGGNVGDRDYFKKVMATGETVVSDPVVSKSTGKLQIVVASPIRKEGKIVGLVGGNVLVENLAQVVSAIKVGKTGYAYMTRGDGMFIAHPKPELIMKYNPIEDSNADPKLVEAIKNMVKGEPGVTRYIFEGVDKYTAYAPVSGIKWAVAVTAPVAELSEQLASLPVLYAAMGSIFIILMGIILALLIRSMLGYLQNVAVGAVKIAGGDLTGSEIPIKTRDEMGQLAGAFNTMLANLKEITGQLQEKSRTVASSATELMASAESVAAGSTETSNIIGQVASAVEQVTNNAKQISASSEQAAGYAKDSSEGIQRIVLQMGAIQKATSASGEVINGLNQSAGKITQIVEMITQIADQTNLLALNAAIEAARAGDQGRGFAVVAEEVRGLSEQSAGAAKQIHGLITGIQQESHKAVQSMNEGSSQVDAGSRVVHEVGGALEKIITSVQSLAGEIQSIASAIDQISSAVENVAASAQQQTATMEEVSSTTEHLTAMAEQMEQLSQRFKLS